MAKGITARDVINLLLGVGAGGLGGMAGGPAARILGGMAGAENSGLIQYTSLNLPGRDDVGTNGYPEEFAPQPYHYHEVIYAPRPDGVEGPYQNMNYMGKADAGIIDEAAEQQSLKEHQELLTKYVRMLPKDATPRQVRDALERGRQEEKQNPRWWNESNDRRSFAVSSSAVKGIRITPEGNVEVQWGSKPDKWYTFKKYGNTHLASKAAKELLKADSIGRAVMPYQRNGQPLKFKNPAAMSWWNRKNYEAGYAK